MKQGRTLTELAGELERQAKVKKDYYAHTCAMVVEVDDEKSKPKLKMLSGPMANEPFGITDNAHGQLANRLNIPKKYYDIMLESAPELLATNINHWFHKKPDTQLVRTLDGRARAFLSDKYRPLDHYDLAEVVLPTLQAVGSEIVSCEVTEKRMYIKAVSPKVTGELAVGDTVQAGLVISNSETGDGSLSSQAFIHRLRCLNGAIVADSLFGFRKAHLGRGNDLADGVEAFYRSDTRLADDKAFWLKLRDSVNHLFSPEVFAKVVASFRVTKEQKIEGDPVKVIEVVGKHFGLGDGERTGVLRHLIEGGDLNRFGVINAVTRFAQDVDSYDRATELERVGGQIIELPRTQWESFAVVQ